MKYAAGIVLYNPTEDNIKHLRDISGCFDSVMVFNNSDSERRDLFGNALYISTGQNEGLAVPYNRFIKICEENHIDFLCLLDQDSMLTVKDIAEICSYIEKNYDNHTAVYAPALKETNEKKWVINSNSFLNIKALYEHNLFYDENYYIDRLDTDFCRTVTECGLLIKIMKCVEVEHRIGEGARNEHSAIRHYYMFKSRLYYNRKFYKGISKLTRNLLQSIRHFIIILFEKDTINKWKACYRASRDYFEGNYGKIKGVL